ncbi:MAG: M1 family metallopeptidase [Bacteroidales bacterium]|nr:MAG: M1 family metallopeptidase [Bacteroidales bacterium]
MNKRGILFSILFFILTSGFLSAQYRELTRQDTLRGSITPERAWWDLTYYQLDVKVNPADKSLAGSVKIQYKVLDWNNRMQIDLQPPMSITSIAQNDKELKFAKDGNVWYVDLTAKQTVGSIQNITIFYRGNPKESQNPPWDGGITWNKDNRGNPFVASTCQGDGASLWWPCKDHMYDEPDSMLISVTTPGNLMDVSNGRFRGMKENPDGTKTWTWFVSNPINNYGVNINIGDYVHFGESYQGELGILDCDYYVLRDNLEKAKEHFKQVPMMLKAFEYWFGPYPFYEDGYKLVEVLYPGMEHQSSVTYGNGYENGYGGRDVSRTGWGDKFDFIIVHESGHEWFANNITYKDIADMWIHESFIAYSEGLFVDYFYGKEAGNEYLRGVRSNIRNDRPIIGIYNVNSAGSGDMYPKGANMLHTLRQIIDNDQQWRNILRGLNETFWHQTVTTEQIEGYMNDHTRYDLTLFFDQYLRDTRIPTLEYRFFDDQLAYRWGNCIRGFDMPVKVWINRNSTWLNPKTRWSTLNDINPVTLVIDKDFYVAGFNITGQ